MANAHAITNARKRVRAVGDVGLTCPRCGGKDFVEVDCGPDSYDDDIFYISQICQKCKLWHSGWTDKWLIDCTTWQDEEDAKEFVKESSPREGGVK
jgi:hypothetical protein